MPGVAQAKPFRDRGRVAGRACVAQMEADGITETVLAGRTDLALSEILLSAMGKALAELIGGASEAEAHEFTAGFIEGANDGITGLRAKIAPSSNEMQ